MLRVPALLFAVPGVLPLFAQQDHTGYHDRVVRAEASFVMADDATAAMALYDEAFGSYERPFVSDLFIAAQIAFQAGDTAHFQHYIGLAFDRGMSFRCLDMGRVLAPARNDPRLMRGLERRFAERTPFLVDTALHDSVYLRMYHEQVLKRSMGRDAEQQQRWHRMEKGNAAWFAAFVERGVFPSEQLLGIYTEEGLADLLRRHGLVHFDPPPPPPSGINGMRMAFTPVPADHALWNQVAFLSFLHYPCSWVWHREALMKAVRTGYLHPKDLCILEEWAALSMDIPGYWRDCKVPRRAVYYNIAPELTVTEPHELEQVERNRAEMHIQS